MIFVNLEQLPLFISLIIILTSLLIFMYFRRTKVLSKFFSKTQIALVTRNLIPNIKLYKLIMLIIAVVMLGIAQLDPRGGALSSDIQLEGIDIMLVFDISRSMDSEDIKPSRLGMAKILGEQITSSMVGNRFGLIAFAADAYRLLPLTTDIDSINLFINDLSTDMISSQSTDIGKALKEASLSLSDEILTHKSIILFTDGENLDGNIKDALNTLKEKGINLSIIGLGTENGGNIPIYDQAGNIVENFKNSRGKDVVTKLDKVYLQNLATDSQGDYYKGESRSIEQLTKTLDSLEKNPFGAKTQSFLEPKFRIFLIIALLSLLLYLFMPEKKIILKLLIVFVLSSSPLYGLGHERSGYTSYKKEDYSSALRFYQRALADNSKNNNAKFGEGAALYKLERGERTEAAFLSLTNTSDKKLNTQSIFNAGNARLLNKNYKGALELYKIILQQENVKSKLYKKAMNNYLYTKAMEQQEQEKKSQDKNQESDQSQDKNNSAAEGEQQDDPQQQESGSEKKEKQEQKNNTPAENQPISPSDIDNILNLAQEEEKKNLSRKNKEKGKKFLEQNKW